MNLGAAIEAARPDVGPMPTDARRHVRERLFDVAVGPPPLPPTTTPSFDQHASVKRRLAALVLLAAAGGGALALNASRNSDGDGTAGLDTIFVDTTVVTEVIEVPPPPTPAPTTTSPPAVGSSEAPLLMPVGRVSLDALSHTARPRGQSALLLRAPDRSTIGLIETDGLLPAPPPTTLPGAEVDPDNPIPSPWERVGSILARGTASGDTDSRRYEIQLPCGTLDIADGDRFGQNRQEIRDLLANIDVDRGVIDVSLPAGWEIISDGIYTGEFEIGLPIEANAGASPFLLVQYPSSELAFAAFGGTQLEPLTFLGSQAWIGRGLDDPSDVTIVGTFGDTAFRVEVSGLTIPQIETEMLKLQAGTIDDWIERFGALDQPDPIDLRTCLDQPEFSVSR